MKPNESGMKWKWCGGIRRACVVLAVAVGCGSVQAQDPALGLHYGSDYAMSQYDAFGAWLGRTVTYRVVFLDKSTWSTCTNPGFLSVTKSWLNSNPARVEVISVPLLPDTETGGFAVINSGSKDAQFRSFATKINSAGIAHRVIVRLGWEANADWFAWSYLQDPNGYKAAFRRVVAQMRAVAPQLRFEFCISNLAQRGAGGAKWTAGYPGNDVVDIISMDIYDHWNSWSTMMNGDAGLAELRAFAVANNKPEAYTEWACSTLPNGHGDNPDFVRNLAAWMRARPGKVLYQAYWNTTDGADAMLYGGAAGKVPATLAAYVEAFGPTRATAPTITAITDRSIATSGDTGAISFTIGDAETASSSLTLTANASDQSLVPLGNITFGGSGANRTVTVKPVANKTGWSTIWIKVSDGGLSSVSSFVLTVSAPAVTVTAPTISPIGDRNIPISGVSDPIAFAIGDAETPASGLTLTANASDQSLVPLGNITFGGSGANRTVTVRPVTNKTGWSTIWIKVSDGALATVTSFVVNVIAADTSLSPPSALTISSQTVRLNGTTGPIPLTIGDAETPVANLIVTANASDQSLVPLGNITFGGSGANRTINIKPVANKTGWSTIWIKVSDGVLSTVTSFVVNVTAPFELADVGNPSIAGSLTATSGGHSLKAGGYDIYTNRDEFSFAHVPLRGDAELTVRVSSLTRAHDWTKAGLMFRGSLARDAAFVAVFVTPAKGVLLQWRAADGGMAASCSPVPGKAPQWVRLMRSADSFVAFLSEDGVAWDLVEMIDVNLPDSVTAGLALTSHASSLAATALFEGFGVD